MGGIRLDNQNEELVAPAVFAVGLDPTALVTTTVPRWQPTATKILAAWPVATRGLPRGLVLSIAVAGAKGSSTDLKCQYRLKRVDQNFGNAVVLTGLATALDVSTTPVTAPVAGSSIIAPLLSPTVTVLLPNDWVVLEYLESGTFNADTRPIVIPRGITWRSLNTSDPLNNFNY